MADIAPGAGHAAAPGSASPRQLKCVVTSPEGLVYQGDASRVIVPGIDGEIGFLPRHAPLVGLLGVGELRIEPAAGGADKRVRLFVEGGFVQVLENRVTVLATAVRLLRPEDRADAESKLQQLLGAPPARSAALEERDAYTEHVHAAKRRLALIR